MAEVKLSQESYDALLVDLERLRKCNVDLEEKLNKEIKLSYEIEGNLYDVSKERDKIINDIADIKRKAEAWDKLKKDTLEVYGLYRNNFEVITGGETRRATLTRLSQTRYFLLHMDELDGTDDFKNFLNDLERGSDEKILY
ncbi:hypothetical protein MT340_005310 [Staphylococcus sp. NRL 16/872]|uniref:hypothetical protein n=1 Tax=Staphylococcus sp. NRL 16/872 TaxID=2930131 RepID=UPI001FB47A5B|nr:hypothetical protein [Staphylococcus sp. NRL 16/872]WEN70330.1 hypothetical protein MT340_005310 [Staphylococcus sp. NRL 16/872]